MMEPPNPEPTRDDPLDAALAAAFAPDSGPPLPAGASVLDALSASLPGVPRVHLRDVQGEPPTPVTRPVATETAPPELRGLTPPAGLQLQGEIARGGMGAVLKGRDTDLGRDLAVKVLLEAHQGRTELARRFVEEAQIAGQLQHPGIVPVYQLGLFADQRPYFTMKLVKGRTLAALLAERKDVHQDRPRWLKAFEQICQTLAYAHARGVIHRDLKPSNVMVGAFGEVQVMDWGLAKVLAEGGAADAPKTRPPAQASVIRTQRSQGTPTPDAGSHTQAGTMLGTPAYMAPEQARGDVDVVDERADVFGLGAILCEVLTGEPPYAGKPADAPLKAQTESLDDAYARLDACGADPELVALARRCLAAKPWDRPRHAGEVAEAVAAYLASVQERLRRAEVERAAAEARAQEEAKTRAVAQARAAAERRARRLTVGLAASVLVTLAFIGVAWRWVERERDARAAEAARQVEEAERGVELALREATTLRDQARTLVDNPDRWRTTLAAAFAALRPAEKGLADGILGERLQQQVQALRSELDQDEQDRRLIERLEAIRTPIANLGYVSRKGVAYSYGPDTDYEQAFREYGVDSASMTAAEAAVCLDARPLLVKKRIGVTLMYWFIAQVVGKDKKTSKVATTPGWPLDVLLRMSGADVSFVKRFQLVLDRKGDDRPWRDLVAEARTSHQPAPVLELLGLLLVDFQTKEEGLAFLRHAQQQHPGDFGLNFTLATSLCRMQPPLLREAVPFWTAAQALRPNNAVVCSNLGGTLTESGDHVTAVSVLRRAVQLRPEWARAHAKLGGACFNAGDYASAVAACREAIRLDPGSAAAFANLGAALFHLGEHENAVRACEKAIRLDPNDAGAYITLSGVLATMGEPDKAITAGEQAMRLAPNHATAHKNLGLAWYKKGELDKALAAFRKAVQLDPNNAPSQINLGLALREKAEFAESLHHLRLGRAPAEGLRELERLVELEQRLPALLRGEAGPVKAVERVEFAKLCYAKKRFADAVRLFGQAFAEQPGLAEDFGKEYRYDAACAAALAGCGSGGDEKDSARWRKQTRDWLRADLAAYAKLVETGKPDDRALVRQRLEHWQGDRDLAGLRDPDAVAKLPADEQAACQQLWTDVAALLAKTPEKP